MDFFPIYPPCFILQEGRKLGYSAMPGVPMVATSPMRHDLSAMSPNGGQPILSYEPPWKALCDFALHSDLDRPGYNHLVSEMHGGGGYDYSRLPPPAGTWVLCPIIRRPRSAGSSRTTWRH